MLDLQGAKQPLATLSSLSPHFLWARFLNGFPDSILLFTNGISQAEASSPRST